MINHIGFIMDGNRRFAVKNNLEKIDGYKKGIEQFLNFIKYQIKYNIYETSYYALSTENLKNRKKDELNVIYTLINTFFKDKNSEEFFIKNKIKIELKGDLEELENLEKSISIKEKISIKYLKDKLNQLNLRNKNDYKFKVNLCLNYGGQREILHSFKQIYKLIEQKKININQITEQTIKENIYFNNSPSPQILVRPGDAPRLSGFMLWDSTYSEIYLTKKFWPELTENDFLDILDFFKNQKRNFGK